MCGFVGILSPRVSRTQIDAVQRGCDRIRHRGPDDEGYVLVEPGGRTTNAGGRDTMPVLGFVRLGSVEAAPWSFVAGFRRLSILDLSPAAHQPMATPDGRFHLVYNGEIYNYKELRAELEATGERFHSSGDTEVVLRACARWGVQAVKRFEGMWAFALYDSLRQQLLLSVDPFGIKPLFYSWIPGGIAFGSEIKALLEVPHVSRRLDPQIYFYAMRGWRTEVENRTIFEDIQRLPPGHFLEASVTAPPSEPVCYWSPQDIEAEDWSPEEAVAAVRDTFVGSVGLHLRSDVPVGVALSGGVDSSSIAAVSRRLIGPSGSIHAFGFVAEREEYSEESWMDGVAAATGIPVSKARWTAEAFPKHFEDLSYMLDEPTGLVGPFAQRSVFAMAREAGVKVLLEGQGADELLAGYPGYYGPRLASLAASGSFIRMARLMRGLGKEESRARILARAGRYFMPRFAEPFGRSLVGKGILSPWMTSDWFRQLGVAEQHFQRRPEGRDRLREDLKLSVATALPALLRFGDRNSMAFSIESRVPFLTTRLAELILSLPEEMFIDDRGTRKAVFREAMRGIVPDRVLNRRRKLGFEPGVILTPAFWSWIDRLVDSEQARSLPGINLPAFRKAMAARPSAEELFAPPSWAIISLIAWAKGFSPETDPSSRPATARRTRVLAVYPSWPNSLRPQAYPFLSEQTYALSKHCDVRVLALFPLPHYLRSKYWTGWWESRKAFPLLKHNTELRVALMPVLMPPRVGIAFALKFGAARIAERFARKLFDGTRPDVIFAHFMEPSGLLAHVLSKRLGCPYVIVEHASDFAEYRNVMERSFKRAAEEASAFVCVSEPLARDVRKTLDTSMTIDVLPNGVDTSSFAPHKNPVRDVRCPHLLFVGHLEHRKGVDLLLEALALRRSQGRDARLTAIGDGPEKKNLIEHARRLGLSANVEFAGVFRNEDLPRFYADADVLVLPSRSESFGVVVIEALASGVPVVVTECGGPEAFVRPNDGRVVPVNDVHALAEAIDDVLNRLDRIDPAELAASARERFSYTAVAPRIAAILDSAALPVR